ncbi:MAG: alpha/beta fold hydrolase [Candidatus Azambacteria bacterium]|nr:alpha/beta fold hydrolase [Candidatus Azambacteria bacterium]
MRNKMRWLFLVVSFVFIPQIVFAKTIVIIGGWGSDKNPKELTYLQESIPGSVAIAPNRCWPLSKAATDVLQQLKEKDINGKLVLIGHSWGGLIAREIDAENPGLIQKIITIGTPNAGFWFAPWFVCEPREGKTLAPLYAVAGDIGSGTDGVVSTPSALGVKKAEDAKIFSRVSHVGLLQSREVLSQILVWLESP